MLCSIGISRYVLEKHVPPYLQPIADHGAASIYMKSTPLVVNSRSGHGTDLALPCMAPVMTFSRLERNFNNSLDSDRLGFFTCRWPVTWLWPCLVPKIFAKLIL